MSFHRYPAYRDSGVEWLGKVPDHWEVRKLKNFAAFTGGGTPSRENLGFWNGSIPWVSPKDMKAEKIIETEEGITQEGLNACTSSLVAPGHVLLVVRSGILKHTIPVAVNAIELAMNQDMKAVLLDEEKCTSAFLFRWIQGLNDRLILAWAKQGATVESVEQEYLANSLIPLPPLLEQSVITTFLDRETAKIDALIAEQQRLIELLQEKRQAVICQAVTKGLNPGAPMKDSGVEWLGEAPEHWVISRLEHSCEFAAGKAHEPFLDDEGDFICVNARFVSTGGETIKRCSENLTPARAGDILIVMSDLPNGRALAKAYFVKNDDIYAVNQRVCRIRALRASARFMFYFLDRNP